MHDIKAKNTYLLFQQCNRSDFFGWDKSSSNNPLFMLGGMRRWIALWVYFALHLSHNLTTPFTVHQFGKTPPKMLREDSYRWAEGLCRSKGENNWELFKIGVMRREGLSQVFGVVKLMALSLPAMQREKEEVGEMGWEHGDSRDVQEKTAFSVNWVIPLCFMTRLFLHLCYKSHSVLRLKLETVRWLQLLPTKTEHEQNNCIILKFNDIKFQVLSNPPETFLLIANRRYLNAPGKGGVKSSGRQLLMAQHHRGLWSHWALRVMFSWPCSQNPETC